MIEMKLAYQGNLKVKATHGPSGTTLTTDAPKDNQGEGSAFSPSDLVTTGLGTCMATLMGIVAKRHQWDLSELRATIRKHMSTDTPRRIAKLELEFEIKGIKDPKNQKVLERAALTCPVKESLHPDIEIKTSFRWV